MYKFKFFRKHNTSYIYFVFSSLWIILTDILLANGNLKLAFQQSLKGLLFATVTSYLLYILLEKNSGTHLKAKQERDEAIETYTKLFEQHGLPQLLIDPSNGQILQVNEAAANYYGWDKQKICSMNISEINTLKEKEVFGEMAKAYAENRNYFKFIHRLANGEIRDVEVYSHPVKLNGRSLLYSIIIDVTNEKLAQLAFERSNQLLKSLVSAIRAMMRYQDKQGIADAVTRALVEEGKYAMAWIGEVPEHPYMPIKLISKWGDIYDYVENIRITWDNTETGQGPTGKAIKLGKPQIVSDINVETSYHKWRQVAQKSGFRSSASVPLFQSGRVSAILNLYSHQPNAFNGEEIDYLEALAADLSRALITIESLSEYERIDRERLAAISRSQESLLEAVGALSETIEVRDPYTAGHQRRVAWLAVEIGKQLKLNEHRLEALHIAGILHDIGKISIPAEILSKPGRLNSIEFELIKQHPKVGEEIIKKVSFDWPIASIVGQHHERIDGTGYPRGLIGEQILQESRILAIADVMEAMISHRPYRPGLSLQQACLELENGIDTKYDRHAVKACIEIMKEGGYNFLQVGE